MNWIPVTEKLPNKDVMVLVYIPNWKEKVTVAELNKAGVWASICSIGTVEDTSYNGQASHWMPLPDGPNGPEQL